MPPTSRRRGFSLIELVVVMTIIAILLTIVVGGINKIGQAQRRGEAVSRLQTIATALREYRQDWGDVPIYNPIYADFDGDGSGGAANEPAGPGLYALLLCDYITAYRFLNDPGSRIDKPWIDDGGTRLNVIPGDPKSMEAAHNVAYGAITTPGGDLTPREEWLVYNLLADPGIHQAPAGSLTDYGKFEQYDELGTENFCSWMMQDPYSGEWKFQPVRRTIAPTAGPDTGGGNATTGEVPFDASDATDPLRYHRQLAHRWTDFDTPLYLPAGDTVVTWSNLFRQTERRDANGSSKWGHDLVLYSDGHVEILPGPAGDVGSDPPEARALLRPAPR